MARIGHGPHGLTDRRRSARFHSSQIFLGLASSSPSKCYRRTLMARTSSSSVPSQSRDRSCANQESSVSMRIALAVREKSCPICLRRIHGDRRAAVLTVCMHAYCIDCIRKWSQLKRNCPLCNAEFDSWFFKIRVSNGKFEEERLPDLNEKKKKIDIEDYRSERGLLPYQRSRDELHSVIRRSRPLPWRRSFGRLRFGPYDERQRHQAEVVAERVLQWRASIYHQRLQALPLPSRNCREQNILGNTGVKEKMQRRIEPWIQRELKAILADSDPSIIVHLATSLYILSLEEKLKAPTMHLAAEDKYVEPLRPFLHNQTNMFWHELRCFAESSFTMEIYDSVVEYKRLD